VLVERKLRPLGLLALPDGSSPPVRKPDPLLGLRWRAEVVPAGAVRRVAGVFSPLFAAPAVLVLLVALLAFDVWLLVFEGVAAGLRSSLYDPVLLLALFASVVVATAWHEIGHASACRRGGASPGVLGAGVYLVWPAFYCDVTDAYRLDRRGRLRTDLGGVYFNGLFALLAAGAYLATGFAPLVLVVLAQHLIVLQQLIPVLRFDGYHVLSDATGVPDILGRVRPILASLRPGREPDPRVTELRPRVRRIVTAYVLLLVPVLLGLLAVLVLSAPRVFATAWDALGLQADRVGDAVSSGDVAAVLAGVVQVLALVLPCAAIALSVVRLVLAVGRGLVRWARGGAVRAAVVVAGVVAVGGVVAWQWWPNGDYEPLRPGERGTLGEVARSVAAIPSGRPSWTEARAAQFGDVPTVREERSSRTEPAGAGERRDRERQRERDAARTTETVPRTAAGEAPAPAPAPTPAGEAPAEPPPATAPAPTASGGEAAPEGQPAPAPAQTAPETTAQPAPTDPQPPASTTPTTTP